MFEIFNPTNTPRAIYDVNHRLVHIQPKRTVTNVELDPDVAEELMLKPEGVDLALKELAGPKDIPVRTDLKPIVIHGMWGLGDNIFQRPFVREYAKMHNVYLDTPWPELYEDIANVYFIRGRRALRTQLKNIARQKSGRWKVPPVLAPQLRIMYNLSMRNSLFTELGNAFKLPKLHPQLDLPPLPAWSYTDKPIALIRPATVRTEWRNEARNPKPEYIHDVSRWLLETHHVVVVADLAAGQETLVGPMPLGHQFFINGELDVTRLLSLVKASDVITGGVGWIVPAAIAADRRAFIIAGGHGRHNAPEVVTEPYWHRKLTFCLPKGYCRCSNMRHNCERTITDLSGAFKRFLMTT